jgi:exopolysaccharide production protein ExoZ
MEVRGDVVPFDISGRPCMEQNCRSSTFTAAEPGISRAAFPRLAAVKRRAAGLFELETGRPRILPMEGLRGMSAALVFFVHFNALFGAYAAGSMSQVCQFLATLGHCGVDVFFALSGYIIYGMLLKQKPMPYFRFVQRRIARLYPTFTAVFLFYVFTSTALPAYSKFHDSRLSPAGYLLANFLMLPGILPIVPLITVAWSLSYELSFYLTIPLLMRWLRIPAWPRPARIAFFIALAAACLWPSVPGLGRHPRLSMFACGILLNETSGRHIRWPQAGAAAALGLFTITLGLTGLRSSVVWASYCGPVLRMNWFLLILLFISTYALAHSSLTSDGFLSRWFQWDWIRWFGNISYSYYLVHGVVLHFILVLVLRLPLPKTWPVPMFLAFFAASFGVTAIGSAGVFLAVEKPFSLRRQSVRRTSPGAAAAGAHAA